jgi:hypothetical protein
MKQGDTCLFRQEEGKRHLWVVLSDPEVNQTEVLVVHLTTKTERSDPACLIQPAEHPFVAVDTAVNYAKPRVMSVALIEKLGVEWREPARSSYFSDCSTARGIATGLSTLTVRS